MPAVSIDWNLALIAARAVFLVFCFTFAAIAFTRWRRATDRNAAQLAEQNALVLARLGAIGVELEASNARIGELAERVAVLNTATSGAAPPSYQIAIRMARGGATRDELTTSCGLTRQEAELVQRLHAPPRERLAVVG